MIKLKQKLFIIFFIFSLAFLPTMNKAKIDCSYNICLLTVSYLSLSLLAAICFHNDYNDLKKDDKTFDLSVSIITFIMSTGLLLKNCLKNDDHILDDDTY